MTERMNNFDFLCFFLDLLGCADPQHGTLYFVFQKLSSQICPMFSPLRCAWAGHLMFFFDPMFKLVFCLLIRLDFRYF